jgi:hypothetical protein
VKLSAVAKQLLRYPWIDWSEMPAELQCQRPVLRGPGVIRSSGSITLPPAYGFCQLRGTIE